MLMLSNLEKRMFKVFVGYQEERDEYQRGEIHRILATACMYALLLTTVLMLISLIIDTVHQTFSFGTIALFLVQQYSSYYILFKLRKTGVAESEYDSEADYKTALQGLKKKYAWAGAQWGFTMLILMEFLFPALAGEKLHISLFSVVLWILMGGAFGAGAYFLSKRNIKAVREES